MASSPSARPVPKSAREYLKYIGALGGLTSRRDLTTDQARKMVAIREAKRALIKAGKRELTRKRWPLNVAARYTETRKRTPRIARQRVAYRTTPDIGI